MKYTFSQMSKRYTNKQLEEALTEWITNHALRIKLVLAINKEGKKYVGYQMQYRGMEMIITGEALNV